MTLEQQQLQKMLEMQKHRQQAEPQNDTAKRDAMGVLALMNRLNFQTDWCESQIVNHWEKIERR